MNIVYKIIFKTRIQNQTPPYYYIGSKSKCDFIDGNIIDHKGKKYYGSSNYKGYMDKIKNNEIEIKILYFSNDDNDYNKLIKVERNYHISNDVVSSIEYFNKGIASVNNFADPNFASYKHIETGKRVRLPRNHPSVISGEYVGVTKDSVVPLERRQRISDNSKGEKNGFYGKHHTQKTKDNISKKAKLRGSQPWESMSEENKEKTIRRFKLPKTKSHKEKISKSNKGYITLKNRYTGESIRIKAGPELEAFDKSIWINAWKYKCEQVRKEYIENPNLCIRCSNPKSWEHRHHKFCSKSCRKGKRI